MRRTTTMTVRVSGALSDFVAANVGETGAYESVSEYVRDLIRRDKTRSEREAFSASRRNWHAPIRRRMTPTRRCPLRT